MHVRVDGVLAAAVTAGDDRPDVAAAHGMGPAHGFDTTIAGPSAGTRWPSGAHTVCVYGIDSWGGTNPLLAACRSVTTP